MKTLKFIIASAFAVIISMNIQAQNPATSTSSKTEMIKVEGLCGMCKTRIEKAAKLEGVSKAEWNKETKILTLVYNPEKISSDDVQKKIAAVGHDTPKYKAEDSVYNSLPGCCKYNRLKE